MIEFDPGPHADPFATLVRSYPGPPTYPSSDFRTEWGPVFYRGRLDGSARVLVLGQDPAQHEVIGRRILYGTAGHRTQGLLAKLGIDRSYVMLNTFLYGVYGQGGGNKHKNDAAIASYRERWLQALLVGQQVEAVVALGGLADAAWQHFRATPAGHALSVPYEHITHPTEPNSAAGGDATKLKQLTKALLQNWNAALARLHPAIAHPDRAVSLVPYGTAFAASDLVPVPAFDVPAGTPAWMRTKPGWAARTGATTVAKRKSIVITATLT